MNEVLAASLLGLATTSSSMLGAAIGLYARFSKKVLACVLAFAAGALISALAIDLALQASLHLRKLGHSGQIPWAFVGSGFALGAILYYSASRFLERRGAAVRFPTRFQEYALERKQEENRALIGMLSKCDLLRHLPAEEIEQILPVVWTRNLKPGETLFRAGHPGDALYIVANGKVAVTTESGDAIAELGEGSAVGEMALLSGGARTATVYAQGPVELLEIDKKDFDRLVAADYKFAVAVERLSHERAVQNISEGVPNPARWADMANDNLSNVSRSETAKMLSKAGQGAGIAIVMGNILDTIPGCFVIGAKFHGLANIPFTLVFGMFLGWIPEAAASAAILTRAGFQARKVFALWSVVLIAGLVAAALGKVLIGNSDSLASIFFQAVAGGGVLALIGHAMIPEAIHEGGSLIVLPMVAGFLFALYLSLSVTFV